MSSINPANPESNNFYHCDYHSTYKYHCQECVKSKNNFWANKRHEKIQCNECGRYAYDFSMETHKNTAYHILMNEIKRINSLEQKFFILEGRVNNIENKTNI